MFVNLLKSLSISIEDYLYIHIYFYGNPMNLDNLFYQISINAYIIPATVCSSRVQTSGVHLGAFSGPKTCRQLIYVWIVFKMPTISHYRRLVEWNHPRLYGLRYTENSKNDSNDFTVSCLVTKPRIHRTYCT